MKEGQLDLEALATAFADSKEIRGCSYWQGLYNGFKAGYSASLPQSSTEEDDDGWIYCPNCGRVKAEQ